ncbi:TNT domain-containing protein, partial [Actinomadura fibrosa]
APTPAPDGAPRGGMRKARVFDHAGPDGDRPSVTRPPVPADEADRVARYLRDAPVVLAARSSAPDQIDPSRGAVVPLTFHTDGTWVWSGAVGYYLREHGVPPEPDLVAHIRSQGFRVPAVDDDTMDAASAAATGRDTPQRVRKNPPAAHSDPGPPADDWSVRLRARLDELNVPASRYRIRATAEGSWCLLPEGAQWTVFQLRNGERRRQVTFDVAEQAAAYLLGSVLLDAPPRPKPYVNASQPTGATGETGPIEPLEGEPPLSLLRDRRVVELVEGRLVDRYGGPGGNLVYAARTPFAQRSLPADWQNRPYHVYRLTRPVEALTGTAVPWFDQPGGGTAYVFRRSIAAMLADGTLVETT